jgi:hypothetical protein
MREHQVDIAVIGGSLGGVAAALAALRAGFCVALSEETDWIGGQFTSQAVPPDEHPWIHKFGCTASYRQLREDIRDYYRRWYPLTPEMQRHKMLNPGGGRVSPVCHEPRVSLAVMQAYLQPFLSSRQLLLFTEHKPVRVEVDGDVVRAVTLQDTQNGDGVLLRAPYFLDATELGELLELGNIESVIGAESQAQTGELHAPSESQPLNQQSFSMCFAISHHPGENHVIDRPREYSFWRDYKAGFWPDKNLSWVYSAPKTLEPRALGLFEHESDAYSLWEYRRIQQPAHFSPEYFSHQCAGDGISAVNWPQMDYWLGPLTGVSEAEKQKHIENSKQLSLSLLYWMQTDAPRPDGGTGYPGLLLREDVVGTRDGMAKYPYVRESRRIQAEFTVCEQHIAGTREDGAEKFADSVGVGSYRIDLHPSTGKSGDGSDGDNYIDVGNWPFQIPLGSLIPVRVENLLPACKNLGVTHITNGCYRLHPVEWNIGEAAGVLAAHCLREKLTPRQVRNQVEKLADFQKVLVNEGVELDWPQIARR